MKPQSKFLIICFFSILLTSNLFPQVPGWQEIGKMKFAISGGQVVFNNSKTNPKFYILGGYSQLLQRKLNIIQIFDPLTNTSDVYRWNMVSPRELFVAACWDSSIVYFGGGINDTLEAFNFYKNGAPTRYDQNINFNRQYTSGTVIADTLYIISGTFFPYDKLPFIVGYNIKKKEISYNFPFPPSAFTYSGDASIFQAEGKIYILGGIINKFASKKIGRFDMANREFQYLSSSSLLSVRAGASAAYISSSRKGIIVGGYNETTNALNTAEQIVVKSNGVLTISQLPPLKYARKYPMTASFGNKVYVFGGTDIDNNVVSQIEMYTDSLATKITDSSVPSKFTLEQNYPNPFNPSTAIKFRLPKEGKVILNVINMLGQEVKTIINKDLPAGDHSISFNGSDFSSGMYFYKIQYENQIKIKKMMLIK